MGPARSVNRECIDISPHDSGSPLRHHDVNINFVRLILIVVPRSRSDGAQACDVLGQGPALRDTLARCCLETADKVTTTPSPLQLQRTWADLIIHYLFSSSTSCPGATSNIHLIDGMCMCV